MNYRLSCFKRELKIKFTENPITKSAAVFLWGPRKTGKTTLLKQQFGGDYWIDLLDTKKQAEFKLSPGLLREVVLSEKPKKVIVDEIQKVPALLDEIHWLLENTSTKFILCGSSARKLKKGAANLLGGRAIRYELFPLVSTEIPAFDLHKALSSGLLPVHYLLKDPKKSIKSYILEYLNEEIINEALVRNIPAFSRFLQIVALTHGQLLNYANVASDAGVSAKTVREYYEILRDTLLGHELAPWRKRKNRRLIETSKFYLFDVGIANHLSGITEVHEGSDFFGRAFEHFMIEEIRAFLSYSDKDFPQYFWRTSNGYEVDLIIGEMNVAIEFKSTKIIREEYLRNLRKLSEEETVKRKFLITLNDNNRTTKDGINIINYKVFLKSLWLGEII